MAAAPRPRANVWHDFGTTVVLIALWIVPWLVITAATWVAGGRPSTSPPSFINPGSIVRRVLSGHGPFDWWVLVAPSAHVVVWRFWTALVVIVIAGTGGFMAVRVQVDRVRHGRLGRLVPAGRRVARTAHW